MVQLVLIFTAMRHFHCFIIFSCFFDDVLIELGSHYTNQTLFVSCSRNYTLIEGVGLCKVNGP